MGWFTYERILERPHVSAIVDSLDERPLEWEAGSHGILKNDKRGVLLCLSESHVGTSPAPGFSLSRSEADSLRYAVSRWIAWNLTRALPT